MPANPQSLRITDAYRAQLVALRSQTAAVVTRTWPMVTLDDLDRSVQRWASVVGMVVGRAQLSAATLTNLYLAAYVQSETGRPAAPSRADLTSYEGRTEDGRPVAELLAGAAVAVRVALGYGHRREEALAAGLARGMRGACGQVLAAGRSAMDDLTQAEPRIVGWRRVASGDACAVCLGACTGAVQADAGVLLCHDSCRCTKEPVLRDVADAVRRQTGPEVFDGLPDAEQAGRFGSGGAEKAAAIRAGDASLADLAQTVPQAARPDQLVEAPLAALAAAR